MRRFLTFTAAVALGAMAAAGAASAQDFGPGMLSGGSNLAAATGTAPSSVIVSATGRARLPGGAAASFEFQVQGKASSAVQALTIRDGRLNQVRQIAQQYGADIAVTDAGFSTIVDAAAQAKHFQDMQAARASHPGVMVPFDNEGVPQLIVANSNVRLRGLPPQKVAAFIDALGAAGVEDVPSLLNNNINTSALIMLRYMGIAVTPVDDVDTAALAKADADAMANARSQAQDIAAAAGRTLGPVEQVTSILKSTQGDAVIVTLAVRFGFAP